MIEPIDWNMDWAEVEAVWPGRLAEIMKDLASPAEPDEVAARTAGDARLADLAGRWDDLSAEEKPAAGAELDALLVEAAYADRPHCIGCGRCCVNSSPTLTDGEAGLLGPDSPLAGRAYTLRAGEPVVDHRLGRVRELKRERIKLAEVKGACVFWTEEDGCAVYEVRPEQCRRLECWNPRSTPEGKFLDRAALFKGDKLRTDYIAAHQAKAPTDLLIPLVSQATVDPRARDELAARIGFDLHVRDFAVSQGHLAPSELDLVLGRPLAVVLLPLGVETSIEDGQLSLTFNLDKALGFADESK